jgi:hypothetical protein
MRFVPLWAGQNTTPPRSIWYERAHGRGEGEEEAQPEPEA